MFSQSSSSGFKIHFLCSWGHQDPLLLSMGKIQSLNRIEMLRAMTFPEKLEQKKKKIKKGPIGKNKPAPQDSGSWWCARLTP